MGPESHVQHLTKKLRQSESKATKKCPKYRLGKRVVSPGGQKAMLMLAVDGVEHTEARSFGFP